MSVAVPEDALLLLQEDQVDSECPYCESNHYYGAHHVASDNYVYNQCSDCGEWSLSIHNIMVNGPA